MERRSLLIGILIGVGSIGGSWVGLAAVDEINGVNEPTVTIQRLNDTHAVVSWSTEDPTSGTIRHLAAEDCGRDNFTIVKKRKVSTDRTNHLAVVPLYIAPTTNTTPSWYGHQLEVSENGNDPHVSLLHRHNVNEQCS